MPETPTVVASPGNCGDTLDSDEDISEEDDDHMAGIEYVAAPPKRYPSVQHIIAPTRRPDVVKAIIKNSFLCNEGVHQKIIAALFACAAMCDGQE